jgi:hypothetical protein
MPVVSYRPETLSLTLREKHRIKVFENRMLRTIFEPKRDDVIEGWRKLYNEAQGKLHFYFYPSIYNFLYTVTALNTHI